MSKNNFYMRLSSGSYYGNSSKPISTDSFRLMETDYSPALNLPRHSHESAYLCFVLAGNFTEVYGNRSRSCRPSTLVFHPAGELHSDYFHTRSRCFNIQMNPQWLEVAQQHSRIIDTPADSYGGRFAQLGVRLYHEFLDFDEFSPLVIEGLTLEIISELSRRHMRETVCVPPRWLKKARNILNEQLEERPSIVMLAESVEVHPVHLAREFRRFYRCTIGEYVRQARITYACHQISTSDASLSDIALAAGFFDHSHFARTFKTHTGMTPNKYRTAYRSQ